MTIDAIAPTEQRHHVAAFVQRVAAHMRDAEQQSGHKGSAKEHLLRNLPLATEDIPEDLHAELAEVLQHPPEDGALYRRVLDVVGNASAMEWGDIENLVGDVPLLRYLSRISLHAPYTYRVASKLIRGSRPSADKLKRLYAGGCIATINLCSEMPGGDSDVIAEARLTDKMRGVHIPMVDNHTPTSPEITTFLETVTAIPDGKAAYVHCEAGVGRTGIMVGCYRIAGRWEPIDAQQEASVFGCAVAAQLAFIREQAESLIQDKTIHMPPPVRDAFDAEAAASKDPTGLEAVISA